MKEIVRRCAQLCVRGIRYRLFRSSVTVVIVMLAVSFLMMMLATSTVDREVTRDLDTRTAGRVLREEWVAKLAAAMTGPDLVERLARPSAVQGTDAWKELRGWGGLTDEQLAQVKEAAERQWKFERFLGRVEPGERSALVGSREGDAIISFLVDPDDDKVDAKKMTALYDKIGNVRTSFAYDRAWLESMVGQFVAMRPLRERILAGHAQAVKGVAGSLKDISVLELIRGDEATFLAVLADNGYELPRADYQALKSEAQYALDAQQLEALLDNRMIRGAIATYVRVEAAKLARGHLYKAAATVDGAGWLKEKIASTRKATLKQIERHKLDSRRLEALPGLPAARIVALAKEGLAAPAEAEPPASRPGAEELWTPDGLGGLVKYERVRRGVAGKKGIQTSKVKARHLFEVLSTAEGVAWLAELAPSAKEEVVRKAGEAEEMLLEVPKLSPERIADVASHRLESTHLAEIQAALPDEGEEGWFGFSRRTGWLIVISFLVCVVGVANAMLMSVTERFREIATMKCLGAMDSFIMINFVLESSLLGTLALANLPGLELLWAAGLCLIAGVVLAALAAVYPAWVAARLAPMEAMRIE